MALNYDLFVMKMKVTCIFHILIGIIKYDPPGFNQILIPLGCQAKQVLSSSQKATFKMLFPECEPGFHSKEEALPQKYPPVW